MNSNCRSPAPAAPSFRRGGIFFMLMVVAFGCSRSLFAQGYDLPEHRDFEVSGFVGRSFGDSFDLPAPESGTVGVEFEAGNLVGVRVNQNLGDYWGVDLEYSFSAQPVRYTNLSPTIQNWSFNQYIHHWSYNVSYLPLPRTKRLRPYADIGVGVGLFYLPGRVKKDALELGISLRDSWEFIFNFGGGFKYLLADQFAVTVDVKDRLSRMPTFGLPLSRHGVFQNAQINFGFTYQWDEF